MVSANSSPRLTSLSHGGGCGCKIAPGLLSELLSQVTAFKADSNLMVGNETSDDAAVYRLNDSQALVATTDFFMPIVDNPYDFGRISATNALSDIYAMGGSPIMALALVGMPVNVMSKADITSILQGGAQACADAGIPVAGGHSIDSVEPIYGLAAMGLVHPDNVKQNSRAQPGDVLILGKALGIGVLSAALKQNGLSDEGYNAMLNSTTQLNRPGAKLGSMPQVHAITDVTGFGLAGHLLEIVKASGLSAHVNYADLPWLPNVVQLASQGFITGASARNWDSYDGMVNLTSGLGATEQALLSDPQTSGGLLVACDSKVAQEVLSIFHDEGMGYATIIGELGAGAPSVTVSA